MPNIEALKQLRRVVENAPDDLLHMRAITEESSCGTAHCALGWAEVDPWFQDNLPRIKGEEEYFDWAERIFGLSGANANKLFAGNASHSTPAHAISKAAVLWNIDELLAGRPPRSYRAVVYAGHPDVAPID